MALFTDGGSRYLAIGRTPHKLGVYILDDGNPRPLRMTFPGLSRFPAWLPRARKLKRRIEDIDRDRAQQPLVALSVEDCTWGYDSNPLLSCRG